MRHNWLVTRSKIYPFLLCMACGVMFFIKNFKFKKKKYFHFIFSYIEFFKVYYCSINLKRQSKHSWLRPDTSSLDVLTFDTKVTEYLCSGWVFFLQTNFDFFLASHFWRIFFSSFKRYCCPELKLEQIFHLWSFFVKLWGLKDCHFGHFDQFGTINARYNSR